jgi:4-hydroxythreonine-4-phosphate dehydrogenase
MMSRKAIVVSAGDPAGCGPLITLQAINNAKIKNVDFFVVGDKKIFKKITGYAKFEKNVDFIDADTAGIEKVRKGFASKLTGQASLNYLKTSLKIMKQQRIKRLVTAPVSKEAIALSLSKFSGHTEYLADHFKVNNFAMLMAAKKLRVLLLSRHIPLREVSYSIKKKTIIDSISLVDSFLRNQCKIKKPRIVLASLNPHAGVNTFMEEEEKKLLAAKEKFKKTIYGPYPADTIFVRKNLNNYDCIICPYHDQAMIPFKLLALKDGVNVTLGLPIIRTSPAHGVAFDLMQRGRKPFSSSMLAAVKLALALSP